MLELVTGGPTGTDFFRLGLEVDTWVRPLNGLQILPNTTISGTVTIQGVVDEGGFAVIAPTVTLVPTSGGRQTAIDVNVDGTFVIKLSTALLHASGSWNVAATWRQLLQPLSDDLAYPRRETNLRLPGK